MNNDNSNYHMQVVPEQQQHGSLELHQWQQPQVPGYVASREDSTTKGNKLVTLAMPLLTLITHIKYTVDHPNVATLRAQIVDEIKTFERKLMQVKYPSKMIIAARYCLCTAIDEAVLGRTWGSNSVWVQGSLLSMFHKETWGGERFYVILESMLRDIRHNIDFIELSYFLLSLGFEGKFFGDENRAAREEIRNRIFYHVRHARTKPERSLSPCWQDLTSPKTPLEKKNKVKKTAIITAVILVLTAAYFNIKTYNASKPVLHKLSKIAQVSPVTIFSQVIQRPIVNRNNND